MAKTKFVALSEQEMRQVSGGCWLCNAWKWLKSHFVSGKDVEYQGASQLPYTYYGIGFDI